MLPTPVPFASLGGAVAQVGWTSTLAIVGLVAVALLAWQLWRAQRQYALELAEQSRQVTEEQEKANAAKLEKEALLAESQAKSELLATLSREIRGHLNGIMGSADLMQDNTLKPQQREHLTTLRASAEALHQSLNDVVEFSSIETGQVQIARALFDLRQPLIEVAESLSPLAALKGLELVLIVAPDIAVQVSGDAGRLRQVLHNLVSNSVKSTASGRVVLRVEPPQGSAFVSRTGATWLRFSISDTGSVIADDVLATVFDRAAKKTSPAPRNFGGSGLELAISKRLVELMGGKIGVRSQPEGGVEFWVVLPLGNERSMELADAAPMDDVHVVVLDDLAPSRIAASAMLTRLGIDHDATDVVTKAEILLRDALESGAPQTIVLVDESFIADRDEQATRTIAGWSVLERTRVVLMARQPDKIAAISRELSRLPVLRKPLLRAETLLEALRAKPGTAQERVVSIPPFDSAGKPKADQPRGRHVLVVDDDAISRSVSSQLLERLGCIVEVALSGTDAVKRASDTRFELIFMDCQMPEMDGFEATAKIRAAAGDKAPPIVALTANTSGPDRNKCFAAGMCDFIGKPVNRAELSRVLQRWGQPQAA
jgi:two-component system, sensor histidine kinase and response regulator